MEQFQAASEIYTSEEISPELRKLMVLEKTGLYVFHGAGENISVLEPRQATIDTDGEKRADGPKSVFASSRADYAIFMALVHERNCPEGYESGVGRNRAPDGSISMDFRINRTGYEQLSEASQGWVYVMKKSDFELRKEGDVEYFSETKQVPYRKIKVAISDLPSQIRITH